MRESFRLAGALALLVGVTLLLGRGWGGMPPFGAFLNPFGGFWGNTGPPYEGEQRLRLEGLQGEVVVRYDRRGVPHIFAGNIDDLYRAQGYITARERLWQMEFSTRVAAGRLSEVVGARALDMDRYHRRIGLGYGAERTLETMMAHPQSRQALKAYSAGVNAYIAMLEPADYPLEYKILDDAPEAWTPLKCALLVKYMAWDLSGNSVDAQVSRALKSAGAAALDDLYPLYLPAADPIVPAASPLDFEPVAVPAAPPPGDGSSALGPTPASGGDDDGPVNGSNNWAVDGTRTASGYPLLANDPHLALRLPSIWYEIQLQAPDLDVYGVSLPGAPGVVIGFNRDIAWGLTNAGADVADWYALRLDEDAERYWYDGAWRPVDKRIETIGVRGGTAVLDTVRYTHHGPIVRQADGPEYGASPPGLALRWLGHEAGNEILSLLAINRARDERDFYAALETFVCPAQNFVFADRRGRIALWHNGRLPLKWPGQGRTVGDGTDRRHDWQGWVPRAHNPRQVAPRRGFVSSANQFPVGPQHPYYFNWRYPIYRGIRVNQLLTPMQKATVDDFRRMQLDDVNVLARDVLPVMLAAVLRQGMDSARNDLLAAMEQWDGSYGARMRQPTFFEAWWDALQEVVWRDEIGPEGALPTAGRSAQLLRDDAVAPWYDDRRTPAVETRDDCIGAAFEEAYKKMHVALGPFGPAWEWGPYRALRLEHLAKIPGLGIGPLAVGGGSRTVNAIGRGHGPSWRMVVELGPQMRAWGIYPGGQSGHPGSRHYADFVPRWVEGRLDELIFLDSHDAGHDQLVGRLVLEGG